LRPERFLVAATAVGLLGLVGAIGRPVLFLALDSEQELMELSAHSPLRPPVVKILKRFLEAPKSPLQRHFGMLVHISNSRITKFHA
jgi:hypothetical protein